LGIEGVAFDLAVLMHQRAYKSVVNPPLSLPNSIELIPTASVIASAWALAMSA
jgi:hypothetical protein